MTIASRITKGGKSSLVPAKRDFMKTMKLFLNEAEYYLMMCWKKYLHEKVQKYTWDSKNIFTEKRTSAAVQHFHNRNIIISKRFFCDIFLMDCIYIITGLSSIDMVYLTSDISVSANLELFLWFQSLIYIPRLKMPNQIFWFMQIWYAVSFALTV